MKSLEFDIALSTRLHRTAGKLFSHNRARRTVCLTYPNLELLDVRFNQLRGNEKDIEAWVCYTT